MDIVRASLQSDKTEIISKTRKIMIHMESEDMEEYEWYIASVAGLGC